MKLFSTPRSAALSTLAIALIAIGLVGLFSGQTAASAAPFGGPMGGPWHGGSNDWTRNNLPPELSSLADVPAGDRFAHFRGVSVSLTDKNNQPLSVNVTPGTVSSVSASSVSLTGNDGATHTYAIDAKTLQDDNRPVKQNDQVVVATVNNSSTATAVFAMNGDGWHGRGNWGR